MRESWELFKQIVASAGKQLQQGWIVNTIGYQPSGYQIMGTWVFEWALLCPYSEAWTGYFINVEYLSFPHESFVELRTSWSVIRLRYIFRFVFQSWINNGKVFHEYSSESWLRYTSVPEKTRFEECSWIPQLCTGDKQTVWRAEVMLPCSSKMHMSLYKRLFPDFLNLYGNPKSGQSLSPSQSTQRVSLQTLSFTWP